MSQVSPTSKIDQPTMHQVAVKLFFAISKEWSLTDDQRCLLAGTDLYSLNDWKFKLTNNEPIEIAPKNLERLSYIAGIYKGLQILFEDPDQWNMWIHKPNRDFGGASALDHMLLGHTSHLAEVRRYLVIWM